MIVKDNIKLPINDLNNYYVVIDFDRTITSGTSVNSWCVLEDNDSINKNYKIDMNNLDKIYRPLENSLTLSKEEKYIKMEEWWNEHLELFIKYKFSKDLFIEAANNKIMTLREGFINFTNCLNKNNIPIIILSAGLTDVIENFLISNNIDLKNIFIVSNKIEFTNNIATGISNNIIHSMNKKEVSLNDEIKEQIKNKNKVILIGDNLSDINMVDKNKHDNVISIAFINKDTTYLKDEFIKTFDITLDTNEDFNTIINSIL